MHLQLRINIFLSDIYEKARCGLNNLIVESLNHLCRKCSIIVIMGCACSYKKRCFELLLTIYE